MVFFDKQVHDIKILRKSKKQENGDFEFSYDIIEKKYKLLYTNDTLTIYSFTNIKENGIGAFEEAQTIVKRLMFATAMASGLFTSVGVAGAWQLYKQRL